MWAKILLCPASNAWRNPETSSWFPTHCVGNLFLVFWHFLTDPESSFLRAQRRKITWRDKETVLIWPQSQIAFLCKSAIETEVFGPSNQLRKTKIDQKENNKLGKTTGKRYTSILKISAWLKTMKWNSKTCWQHWKWLKKTTSWPFAAICSFLICCSHPCLSSAASSLIDAV